MERILIVGSGASGVQFALSVLRKGYEVLMVDVGGEKPEVVETTYSLNELKGKLGDPVHYFLGESFEGVLYPSSKKEYYGFPPSKSYVFANLTESDFDAAGFAPLFSFAQGGLAEAWTGGVYPFNDDELDDFPFGYKDIGPFYDEVARRIGISGIADDLGRFMPVHDALLLPLDLDEHSATLLAAYEKHKDFLNRGLRCYFGRSRTATLSQDKEERQKCGYLGRCLWGCPTQSFYTPSITLQECRQFPNFQYHGNLYVTHFKFDSRGRVTHVVARSLKENLTVAFPVDKLVLAAGTLCSSKIFLESIFHETGEIVKLPGLMDNRQVLIPFVNLKMLGSSFNPNSYQYHQVAFGLESEDRKEYLHGLITTLKTALYHPIIQKLPLDFRTSIPLFRYVHAALGLVNLNFPDRRREDSYVTLRSHGPNQNPTLVINHSRPQNEQSIIKGGIRRVKRVLRRLKCLVPPGMAHVRPMGASVHYAGTLPMSKDSKAYTTSEYCQSSDFSNLYIVDGTTFPFLPAKNITFTLMANAVRVAETVF